MAMPPFEVRFEIEEGTDGSLAIVAVVTSAGQIEVIAELIEVGRVLRVIRTHVQSNMPPNAFGPTVLRAIADAAMEEMDYDAIEIEGAARTTGAGPGRIPKPIRFARRRRVEISS